MTLSAFFLEGDDAIVLTQEQRELLDHWGALSPTHPKIVLELLEHLGMEK